METFNTNTPVTPNVGKISAPELLRTRRLFVVWGVPIDDLTMEQALQRIDAFIALGRRDKRTHQIATVNADFIVKSATDPELRYLLQQADMATADGMPLVWSARLLGVPLSGRVTGADLIPALSERAAEKDYTIYMLGAKPGVADRASKILTERFPRLQVVGIHSPPFRDILEMDEEVLDKIQQANPDILLVAFGNPKQEKWIGLHGPKLKVPVMIGVGGTLDFIAGETLRAPYWMQKAGLEWLFRLVQEPRRLWKRYVHDLWGFSTFFFRQWWNLKRYPQPMILPGAELVFLDQGSKDPKVAVLNLEGHLDISYRQDLQSLCGKALEETNQVVVNLARVDFMDSSIIGALVGLVKEANAMDGTVHLVAPSPRIKETLRLMRLDQLFTITDSLENVLHGESAHAETPSTTSSGGWAVYRLPQRLDGHSTDEVNNECLKLLSTNNCIVLDFSLVNFLTSAGLALLVRLQREAEAHGGSLRLAGCNADVSKVLQMVRFDLAFSIFSDVQRATSSEMNGS